MKIINHLQNHTALIMSAVAAVRAKGADVMNDSRRMIIDGAMVIFLVGVSFNAGIQYNTTQMLTERTTQTHIDVKEIKGAEELQGNQITSMQAQLADIKQLIIEGKDKK